MGAAWEGGEGQAPPRPHLFHRDGSSSCRSTFISSNTFCALTSSSSACRQDQSWLCRLSQPASRARPGQATPRPAPTSRPASSDRALGKGGGAGQPLGPCARPSEGAEQPWQREPSPGGGPGGDEGWAGTIRRCRHGPGPSTGPSHGTLPACEPRLGVSLLPALWALLSPHRTPARPPPRLKAPLLSLSHQPAFTSPQSFPAPPPPLLRAPGHGAGQLAGCLSLLQPPCPGQAGALQPLPPPPWCWGPGRAEWGKAASASPTPPQVQGHHQTLPGGLGQLSWRHGWKQ